MRKSAIETLLWGTHAPPLELGMAHHPYDCEEDEPQWGR